MTKSRPPYDPEFRQKLIELHRGGRPAKSLAADFGLDDKARVAELFMCGEQVLAHVEGNVFHRLRRKV